MIRHLLTIASVVAVLGLCIIYPFLPGKYDGLSVALSTIAQTSGVLGLGLVPIGAAWLKWPRRGYIFARVSLVLASLVALVGVLVGFAMTGPSLGVFVMALWLGVVSRLVPGIREPKGAGADRASAAPQYLIAIPVASVVLQVALAAPAAEFSRNRAISNSAELINDLERYRGRHGRYPVSLSAVWKDYLPSVVGIEAYHYAPQNDAYDLFFEQPLFVFANFGAREFVVYNNRDEHLMISHASWHLLLGPEGSRANQGWFASHTVSRPHWKKFWFD